MDDISIPTEFNGVEALQNIFNIYDEQIKQLHSKCCESEISTVKAQQDLYYCNLEIDQLYRTREVSEQEINNLTSQIATLKKKIKKLKWVNKSRELYLTYWEDHTETDIDNLHKKISHLLECKTQLETENEEIFIICEEVTYLRKRIVDLTNEKNEVQRILTTTNNLSYPKDISTDKTDTPYENMADWGNYPDPRDGIQAILDCRINIANRLRRIRGYIDNGQSESSHVGILFDEMAENITKILDHSNTIHDGIGGYMDRAANSMRQITQLRHDLNRVRNDLIRTEADRRRAEDDRRRAETVHILALNNETEARRQIQSERDACRRLSRNMVDTITGKQNRIYELLREKGVFRLLCQRKDRQIAEHRRTAHRWTVRYNNDTTQLQTEQDACKRLCRNMVDTITGKQDRIYGLLREKGIFQFIIRRRDQTILLLQQQIL